MVRKKQEKEPSRVKLMELKSEACVLLGRSNILANFEVQTLKRLINLVDVIMLDKIHEKDISKEGYIQVKFLEVETTLKGSTNEYLKNTKKIIRDIQK